MQVTTDIYHDSVSQNALLDSTVRLLSPPNFTSLTRHPAEQLVRPVQDVAWEHLDKVRAVGSEWDWTRSNAARGGVRDCWAVLAVQGGALRRGGSGVA